MPKSLLLADDSITIQKVVQITFASEDFTITSVDNGDAALEKIKSLKPNIVLADVVMPGKNGYELCQAIKSDPALKATPVILLAGTFEPFDPERAKAVGADDFIVKPFETQALIDKVKKLVGMEITSPLAVSATPMAPKAASPAFAPPSNPLFAAKPAAAPANVTPIAAPLGQPPPKPIAPPTPSTASPFQGSGPLPAFGQAKPAAPAPVPAKDPFGMGPMFQTAKPPAPPPVAAASDPGLPDIDMGDVEPMEVQKPTAPPPTPLAQAIAPKVVAATSAAIAGGNVELNAAVRETIERIVWEIVPELAEAIIREELERLLREKA